MPGPPAISMGPPAASSQALSAAPIPWQGSISSSQMSVPTMTSSAGKFSFVLYFVLSFIGIAAVTSEVFFSRLCLVYYSINFKVP